MFTTSITIVESDLHIKAPVKNNGNNGHDLCLPVAKGTTNHDEVTNDTKPEPVPELTTPEPVDGAVGPKPEPVPRPPTPDPYPPPAPIFWRLLWLQMLAPINPTM
ncbi:unnamed protein product [Aureobasidium pullulans]|nr:unnamed protein product [Aureobasidium pullulans]